MSLQSYEKGARGNFKVVDVAADYYHVKHELLSALQLCVHYDILYINEAHLQHKVGYLKKDFGGQMSQFVHVELQELDEAYPRTVRATLTLHLPYVHDKVVNDKELEAVNWKNAADMSDRISRANRMMATKYYTMAAKFSWLYLFLFPVQYEEILKDRRRGAV